ncbi:MAG: sulfatase-like hydrolase/transferase [Clostridia bacterium]|nr:sulfatase-like hydrolase/transferase [Clostridia bacterium]
MNKKNILIWGIPFVIGAIATIIIEKYAYPNVLFVIKRGTINFAFISLSVGFIEFIIFNYKNISFWNYIKCVFSFIIIGIAAIQNKNALLYYFGFMEVVLIFAISSLISNKSKKIGYVVNSFLLLMFNIQVCILIFGGTFVKRIMITNLISIEDLAGKATVYISSAITVVIVSFLLFKGEFLNAKYGLCCTVFFIFLEVTMFILVGNEYSPAYGYLNLLKEEVIYRREREYIREANVDKSAFYKEMVENYMDSNHGLGEKPNIILILTEGLSQNIVLDDRNIMPNIKEYEKKSINFTGYFNHTFATYKGIIGQLYSGFQHDDLDSNTLISIQSILKDNGYDTIFINTEPHNRYFSKYIKNFGFDKVESGRRCSGISRTMSDREAYGELRTQLKKLKKSDKPFFICMYSFGTHISLDSSDEVYGDGETPMLNKFYDVDYQFGKFIKEFESSELFNNTIFALSADHCTYKDKEYLESFGNVHPRSHPTIDEIPFFIYHKGVKHADVEVNGLNSLCLVPTILDYVDISGPNYFLGDSLFAGEQGKSEFKYVYQSDVDYCTTCNKEISGNDKGVDEEMKKRINEYFSICTK